MLSIDKKLIKLYRTYKINRKKVSKHQHKTHSSAALAAINVLSPFVPVFAPPVSEIRLRCRYSWFPGTCTTSWGSLYLPGRYALAAGQSVLCHYSGLLSRPRPENNTAYSTASDGKWRVATHCRTPSHWLRCAGGVALNRAAVRAEVRKNNLQSARPECGKLLLIMLPRF